MSDSECAVGSYLQITAFFVFTGYFLLFIRKYFLKPAPRVYVLDDDITTLGRVFTRDDVNSILKFKEYLLELQNLSKKMAEEKDCFSVAEEEDTCVTDYALEEMGQKYSSVQEAIDGAIKYKQHRTDDQFEQAQKLIENLEREITLFKSCLENSPRSKELLPPSKFLVEENTQTNEGDLISMNKVKTGLPVEKLSKESISQILTAVKNCMDTIVEESDSNWKTTIEEISNFLKGNHGDVKKQLEISIDEYLEKNKQLQISSSESVCIQTESIEKKLLDIYLFLDRQLVDAQAVAETLRFFNRKFEHFAQRCDKRWEDSCTNYITTCNRVQEAQENMNFSSSKISKISCSLKQRTEALDNLLSEFGMVNQTVSTIIASGDFGMYGKDQMESVCYAIDELDCRVFKVEDVYRFNMRCILDLIEKPGKKLEYIIQYIEELGILNEFMLNITKTYESMVSGPSADGRTNQMCSIGDYKDNESIQDACKDGDKTEMSYFDVTSQSVLESRSTLVESDSRQRIISMLNEVIKKSASETSKVGNVAAQEKDSEQTWRQNFAQAELKMKQLNIWEASITETALSDINSDCLLPKSSGSSDGEE